MVPPQSTGLETLGLSDSALHTFAAALQGVVAAGISAAVPSPSLSAPTGKVATLSLLHLRFSYGVAVDGELPPIWEAVARGKGRLEGLFTLNRALVRGLPSCFQLFGGRAHFSAFLPLLVFVKNMSLMNPSLDPAYKGGGVTPWMEHQGSIKASAHGGAYASLLAQELDGHLALSDPLWMAVRVQLAIIPSAE